MTKNETETRKHIPLNKLNTVAKKQWIKCTIWSIIYILFIVWVGNFWWLFLLPFIFDLFITKYIPYDWWKKYKTTNKTLYTICSWVDAIVFALIAVYFINLYLFQNYQIPTSSLEKSLLVGDFLFVSKASYGPRIPNTPLSFPLVQHTFPNWLGGGKSYIDKPHWDYKRLKGFDSIERNDIVVFNFPAGDTVATLQQNPDYYTLCYYNGRQIVTTNKNVFGDIVYRPVDRRENYVKRCVAIAGDSLQIINNQIYVNGQPQEKIEGIQYNYFVQTDGTFLNSHFLESLNISVDDRQKINGYALQKEVEYMGLNPELPIYHFPLTAESKNKLAQNRHIIKIITEPEWFGGEVFPLGGNTQWTRDNFGPIYIPKKGATIALTINELPIYERIIRNYEENELTIQDSTIYINGEIADTYTFKMDYYWMMGDNRHKSSDSRYWGYVPEDHIVGRPVFIWLSLDKDKTLFNGKIRWKRFFKNAEY
jgi:signal peptidase I